MVVIHLKVAFFNESSIVDQPPDHPLRITFQIGKKCHPTCRRHVEWQPLLISCSYRLLAGGTMPFMRKYSTNCP
jgi:hypothetical protein